MSYSAKEKREALAFLDQFGLEAAMAYAGVGRATIDGWRKTLRERGTGALANHSTAPTHRRQRHYAPALIAQIKQHRHAIPNAGGQKLRVLLAAWCDANNEPLPSARTLARIIADDPHKMRHAPTRLTPKGKPKPLTRRVHKERYGKSLRADWPGQCVAFDTIVRFVAGYRRYLLTAIDHHSRFAVAAVVPDKSSHSAAHFADLVKQIFPAPITQVLTDNGSEFAGAFAETAKHNHWRHCHTYPKSPKMNAINERFNRTIQEEFVDYHDDLLINRTEFNHRLLTDYLITYNTKRPHAALNYMTPCRTIMNISPESGKRWHRTPV